MSNTSTAQIDLNKFLDKLDAQNKETYSFHVFVPSLQKEIPFVQINTLQQKSLIKSIIDSQVYNTEFIFTLYNIIKNNCLDKDIDISQLTILDKMVISLALRCKSISNVYVIEVNGVGNTKIKHEINLDDLIERTKKIEEFTADEIIVENYKLFVGPPTIGIEFRIEKEIRSKGKNNNTDINTPDQLREVVGEAFITELIKYIKSIEVSDGEHITSLNLRDMSCKDAIKVLERLPIKVIEQVLAYAEAYNKTYNELLTIKIPKLDPKTDEMILTDQEITLNGSFFIRS